MLVRIAQTAALDAVTRQSLIGLACYLLRR